MMSAGLPLTLLRAAAVAALFALASLPQINPGARDGGSVPVFAGVFVAVGLISAVITNGSLLASLGGSLAGLAPVVWFHCPRLHVGSGGDGAIYIALVILGGAAGLLSTVVACLVLGIRPKRSGAS